MEAFIYLGLVIGGFAIIVGLQLAWEFYINWCVEQ